MRSLLLASAALLGLAAGGAYAQTSPSTSMGNTGSTANYQGTTGSYGTHAPATMGSSGSYNSGDTSMNGSAGMGSQGTASSSMDGTTDRLPSTPGTVHHASNTGPGNNSPDIAPALPTPPVGADAGAMGYLHAAQQALNRHRTGEAQEAIERAETRMLDRSVAPSSADQPINSPSINRLQEARHALGQHDIATAQRLVNEELASASGNGPATASGMSGTDVSGGGMSGGGMSGAGMSSGGSPSNYSTYPDSGSATPGNTGSSAAGAGAAGITTTPHLGSTIGAGNSHYSPSSPTGAAPPRPPSAGGQTITGTNAGGSSNGQSK